MLLPAPWAGLILLPRRPRGWLEGFEREDWLCLWPIPCCPWHLLFAASAELLVALCLAEVCMLLPAREAAERLLPPGLLSWLGELEARPFSGERLLVRPVPCCLDCLLRSAAGELLECPTSCWLLDPWVLLSAPGAGVWLLPWCSWLDLRLWLFLSPVLGWLDRLPRLGIWEL